MTETEKMLAKVQQIRATSDWPDILWCCDQIERLVAASSPLQWTENPPSEPGWYGYRYEHRPIGFPPYKVTLIGHKTCADEHTFSMAGALYSTLTLAQRPAAEWCGPIRLPMEGK